MGQLSDNLRAMGSVTLHELGNDLRKFLSDFAWVIVVFTLYIHFYPLED